MATRSPCCASTVATVEPAGPPPTTRMLYEFPTLESVAVMQYPCDGWWSSEQAWVIKPTDSCGEERPSHVSGTEIGERTQPEKRQQQRRHGCHAGAPPDVVAHCFISHEPPQAGPPALGWP